MAKYGDNILVLYMRERFFRSTIASIEVFQFAFGDKKLLTAESGMNGLK